MNAPPSATWTNSDNQHVRNLPTAPIAATGLIGGFAVAVLSGSRALGGLVLAICGLACIAIWLRRDGQQTAVRLAIAGLLAFALSHLLGLIIGAWPAAPGPAEVSNRGALAELAPVRAALPAGIATLSGKDFATLSATSFEADWVAGLAG